MNHTISKQELRRPDQITETARKFFGRILQNQKLVLSVLGLIILSGVVYIVIDKTSSNKEMDVQEQYYSIEKTYLKKKEAFEKFESEKKEPSKKVTAKPDEVKAEAATGDLIKDYGVEVDAWTKLIESHQSSKAGAMAALELSQLYVKYNKVSDAVQLLAKVKNQQNSNYLLGALVFHSYANLLANQGQCQEAVGIWENLEKKKSISFLNEPALMGKALCLESMGQVEKAESLLKDLVAGKNNNDKSAQQKSKTLTQKNAEKYLRYLQVKKNLAVSKPS